MTRPQAHTVMAGPGDTTASMSHPASGTGPHERILLHEDDTTSQTWDCGAPRTHSLTPHSSLSGNDASLADTTKTNDDNFRKKNPVETSLCQTDQPLEKTSPELLFQDDDTADVFGVGHNSGHTFFIEDDDDVDDVLVYEEDYNDSDSLDDNEESDDYDAEESAFLEAVDNDVPSNDETGADKRPQHDNVHDDSGDADDTSTPTSTRTQSLPLPIPHVRRAATSPLMTVCRHSHSHMVVRCQVRSVGDSRASSSCPAAFSHRWTTIATSGRGTSGRKRRNTTGSKDLQSMVKSRSGSQPCHLQSLSMKCDLLPDDPAHPCFKGRGRSASESDVQRLLMTEMSKELRKIGDLFHNTRPRKLATVSESMSEEDPHTF